jgi:deoxyribonuclease-4
MLRDNMPLLGAHMSISGGLFKALFRGKERGCKVVQIFTKSPNRWSSRELSEKEIDAFNEARSKTSIEPVAAHDSYLINLASPRGEDRKKSFDALMDEMERAERLSIPYLVMHPGAHLGDGEKAGIERIAEALNHIFDRTSQFQVKILLETTAGQGTNLGYRFEHLAEIIEKTGAEERLGVCVDTCHIFAAGYDFRDEENYKELVRDLDATVGLNRCRLFHVNDSKYGLGSRIDRHEHIGRGCIGERGLSFFLNSPIFGDLPFLLETPKGSDEFGADRDLLNIRILKRLMEE